MMELILSGQMKDDNDSGRYSETECDNFCGVRQQLLILGSIITVLCHTDQLPVNPCITEAISFNIWGDTPKHCSRVHMVCMRPVFC